MTAAPAPPSPGAVVPDGADRRADTLGQPAPAADAPADPRAAIAALGPWFHNLHLPDGTQTLPDHFLGGDFPAFKWNEIGPHLPADLHGWRVLDVGCNAGFYSFELARRGADVLGIDVDPHYLRQAEWAVDRYGLRGRVRFRRMEVYELARSRERFDLVWFMGVFYHLRYPLLALDILAERTARTMVFQTLTLPGDEVAAVPDDLPIDARSALRAPGWPTMAFIEKRLAGDPTNWWAADHAAVEALLRSAGLVVKARPGHEIYLCEAQATGIDRGLWGSQYEAIVGNGR